MLLSKPLTQLFVPILCLLLISIMLPELPLFPALEQKSQSPPIICALLLRLCIRKVMFSFYEKMCCYAHTITVAYLENYYTHTYILTLCIIKWLYSKTIRRVSTTWSYVSFFISPTNLGIICMVSVVRTMFLFNEHYFHNWSWVSSFVILIDISVINT